MTLAHLHPCNTGYATEVAADAGTYLTEEEKRAALHWYRTSGADYRETMLEEYRRYHELRRRQEESL